MVDVNIEKLQAASRVTHNLDYPGGMRLASGLNLEPNGVCRAMWGKELNECFTELLGTGVPGSGGLLNAHALVLDGSANCWCTTPDALDLDIVGDIDIRVELNTQGGGITQAIVSKWNTTGNQRSYMFVTIFGLIQLRWSVDGIAELSTDTANPQVFADLADRITLDVVNGVNRVQDRYTGRSIETLALQDSDIIAGNTSIFASTSVLGIGAHGGGAIDRFTGRIYRAEVRNGIGGTLVANPDFRALAAGTTSFTDSTGKLWTLQGTAKIV